MAWNSSPWWSKRQPKVEPVGGSEGWHRDRTEEVEIAHRRSEKLGFRRLIIRVELDGRMPSVQFLVRECTR